MKTKLKKKKRDTNQDSTEVLKNGIDSSSRVGDQQKKSQHNYEVKSKGFVTEYMW